MLRSVHYSEQPHRFPSILDVQLALTFVCVCVWCLNGCPCLSSFSPHLEQNTEFNTEYGATWGVVSLNTAWWNEVCALNENCMYFHTNYNNRLMQLIFKERNSKLTSSESMLFQCLLSLRHFNRAAERTQRCLYNQTLTQSKLHLISPNHHHDEISEPLLLTHSSLWTNVS